MSKSLGNFIIINDFLRRYPANYLRFFVLKNLWRSPIDYSESVMVEVKAAVEKIEEFLRKLKAVKPGQSSKRIGGEIKELKTDFYKKLDDDFNTPQAFSVLFDFIKKTNQALEENSVPQKDAAEIYEFFAEINALFGIIDLKRTAKTAVPASVKKLIKDREDFRKKQEWQKADEARREIEKQGYTVEDTKDGPAIKRI